MRLFGASWCVAQCGGDWWSWAGNGGLGDGGPVPCRHVAILSEAALIIFGGGFPRHGSSPGRRAAQAAIFAVQRQLEALVIGEGQLAVALCDRGTEDRVAYWPGGADEFSAAMGTTQESELGRYRAVIYLAVPVAAEGHVTQPIRTESAQRAAEIDRAIAAAWDLHHHRFEVPAGPAFDVKAQSALAAILARLPDCYREATGSDHRGGPP